MFILEFNETEFTWNAMFNISFCLVSCLQCTNRVSVINPMYFGFIILTRSVFLPPSAHLTSFVCFGPFSGYHLLICKIDIDLIQNPGKRKFLSRPFHALKSNEHLKKRQLTCCSFIQSLKIPSI